jgi:hypothetical protein
VGLLGVAMIAFGVIHFVMGGDSFTSDPTNGTVNGDTWLGVEGNGWTNVLFVGGGLLLAFGAPFHWAAKSMALIVGLALGAAALVAASDGDDVFGIFAANGRTELVWGVLAAALIVLSQLPRVGGRRRVVDDDVVDDDATAVADRDGDREGRFAHEREGAVERDGVVDSERDREVVAPADGGGPEERRREL